MSTFQYKVITESKAANKIKNELVIQGMINHAIFFEELTIGLILQHLLQPKYFLKIQLSKEHSDVSETKWIQILQEKL